jgi:hypothetical protein
LAFGIRVLNLSSDRRERRFDAVTQAIRTGKDLDDPNGPFAFTRNDLRTIQYNLRDIHGRQSKTAKHLLLRLNDLAAGSPVSTSLPENMTVEHVLPRKVTANGPQWRTWFPDADVREQCTESLGNLLLVTKPQNDRAANHDLAFKLKVYFATANAPDVAINDTLRGRAEWKEHDIKARESELLRQIDLLWQFAVPAVEAAEPSSGRRRKGLRRHAAATQPHDANTAP